MITSKVVDMPAIAYDRRRRLVMVLDRLHLHMFSLLLPLLVQTQGHRMHRLQRRQVFFANHDEFAVLELYQPFSPILYAMTMRKLIALHHKLCSSLVQKVSQLMFNSSLSLSYLFASMRSRRPTWASHGTSTAAPRK